MMRLINSVQKVRAALHSHILPVVSSTRAVDRVELVEGEGVSDVVVVAPVKHPPCLLSHLQPPLPREGPVDELREEICLSHVLVL